MNITLKEISEWENCDVKYKNFVTFLRENIHDYKILGVFDYNICTPLKYESLINLENDYKNSCLHNNYCSKVLSVENNTLYEAQFELLKEIVSNYQNKIKISESLMEQMDEHNRAAANVFNDKGPAAAIEYMFTNHETGQKMDYATMRSLYG